MIRHRPGRLPRHAGPVGSARHGRKVGTTGDTPAIKLATLGDVLALLQRGGQ